MKDWVPVPEPGACVGSQKWGLHYRSLRAEHRSTPSVETGVNQSRSWTDLSSDFSQPAVFFIENLKSRSLFLLICNMKQLKACL